MVENSFPPNGEKSWFLAKINKIEKPFANMTKQRREQTKINKVKDEIRT
jgi:hypothetical protein